MTPGRVVLLRHGETTYHGRFNGQARSQLTALGWQQMREAIGTCRFQRIITSPLPRCAEFAERLAVEQGLPLDPEPDFMEMDFGDWEGCTSEEIHLRDPDHLGAFWADPETIAPPNGETLAAMRERVLAAWRRRQPGLVDEQVLIITHAGVIRLLIMELLDASREGFWRIPVPYASLSCIQLNSNATRPAQLLSLNGMGPC